MLVYDCVCESVLIHPFPLPNDDVETKHFWPAYLSEVWGLVCWCYRMEAPSQDCVLSSTEQMVLYGVGSVYSIIGI